MLPTNCAGILSAKLKLAFSATHNPSIVGTYSQIPSNFDFTDKRNWTSIHRSFAERCAPYTNRYLFLFLV